MKNDKAPAPPAPYQLVTAGAAQAGDIAYDPLQGGWLHIMRHMVGDDVSRFYALARKTLVVVNRSD